MTDPQSSQNPEMLPQTSLGIDSIKQDIAILKQEAETLETKRVDFEKNKKDLAKEECDRLEQEIDIEAKRIEEKKKELLELVKQTKGELEILKGSVELTTEKSQLDELEKEIKSIQGEKKNMVQKTRNWVKENPGKTVLFATGVGLLARGIAKLIKRRKERKSGVNGQNKESNKGGVRKRVLGIGAGVAAFFGIKWLYEKFKGETMDDKESQTADFDKLSEVEKLKYNTFGGKVNDMYTNIYQREIDDGLLNDSSLGTGYGSADEKKYAGVVPFAMDKTYSNVGAMLTEGTVNRHVWKKNIEEYSALLKGYSKETLQTLFGTFLVKLESFNVLGYKPADDISVKIQEWLVTNQKEACRQLDFFFRQFVMTLTYLEEKKIQLRKKLIIQKINVSGYGTDKKKLSGLDEDDQNNLIEEAMDDEKWMESIDGILKAQFDNQKISNIEISLTQYDLYNEKISDELQKSITSLDEKRDDLLDYDDDLGTDILDRAENDIQDGSLEKENQENLSTCADDILDDAIDANGEGFMQMYFEPLAIACNMDAAVREKFLEESGGRELLDNFALGLQKYKEKIDAGTMTKEDVTNFKIIVNKYLAFKKEVVVAIRTMQNINSDNPDVVGRIINALWAPIVGLYECFTEKMPPLQWTSKFCTGMIVTGGLVYITGWILGKKGLRTVGKGMVKIGGVAPYLLFKGAMKGIKYAGGKMIFSGIYRERKILESSDPKKLFRRAFMSGEISPNRALKIAEKLDIKQINNGAEIRNINELLIKYGAKDAQEAELIVKYMNNPKLRNVMMKKTRAVNRTGSDWFKHNIYERSLNHEYTFVADNLKKLQEIDGVIKGNTGKNSAKVLENMLNTIDAKNFNKLHTMMSGNSTGLLDEINSLFIKTGNKLSPEKFGKLLGKHLHQFTDATDMRACISILNSSNIDAKNVAVMIRKRKEINIRLTKGEKLEDILIQVNKNFIRRIATKVVLAPVSADLLKAQDEIIDAIVKESDALKLTLKNSNIFIDQPISMVDDYYKIQVDGLETFKLQVKSFTKVEVDGFKQLKSMKFKATHIAELFALGKTNPAIKAALNTTDDLDALLAVLKAQKAANPIIKISDDLIKILDDIQLAKVAGKYTDDVLQAAAVLFKFVANIT